MKRVYSKSPAVKSAGGKTFCMDNGEGNTEYNIDGRDDIAAKNVGIHIINQEYIDTRMYPFATNMIIKSENKHKLDRLSIFTSKGFDLLKITGDIEAESCSNVLIRKGIKGDRLYNKCIIKTHKYVDLSRYEFIGFDGLNIMTTEKELFIDFKDKYTIMCRNSLFIVPNNEIKIYIYTSNTDMLEQLLGIGYGLGHTTNLGTLQNIKVIKNRKEWHKLQGEK